MWGRTDLVSIGVGKNHQNVQVVFPAVAPMKDSSVPEAEVTFVTVRFVYDTIALNALFADLPEQSAIPQIISSALTR